MRGQADRRTEQKRDKRKKKDKGGKKKQKRKLCPSGTFKGAHVP